MAKPYIDPTNGQWVGERETRAADGEISRETEWFDSEAEARQFGRSDNTVKVARQSPHFPEENNE